VGEGKGLGGIEANFSLNFIIHEPTLWDKRQHMARKEMEKWHFGKLAGAYR
jgi:hypothetical protein